MSENSPIVASDDIGPLGVLHLKRFWWRSMSMVRGGYLRGRHNDEWELDRTILDGLGTGIEETLKYLYQHMPSYDEFESWIVERNGGGVEQRRIEIVNATIRNYLTGIGSIDAPSGTPSSSPSGSDNAVLSPDDLAFFEENGYVILRNAVSADMTRGAENAVWEFLEMDPADPETWYQTHPARQGIMVQFFQHPALEANRHAPRIRRAFEQLWGTDRLVVNTDRVSFNVPERKKWPFPGPRLHWDTSLELPIPYGLQGLLYLTDTTAEQGAFTCVPGFHRRIEEWLKNLSDEEDPRLHNFDDQAIPIEAPAGSLVIWHHALPHGSRPNRANVPRIVQYVNMHPIDLVDRREWR